jgi:exonuclease III
MMKVLSWNCGGLGSPSKSDLVKSLVKQEKLKVLLLQETKICTKRNLFFKAENFGMQVKD